MVGKHAIQAPVEIRVVEQKSNSNVSCFAFHSWRGSCWITYSSTRHFGFTLRHPSKQGCIPIWRPSFSRTRKFTRTWGESRQYCKQCTLLSIIIGWWILERRVESPRRDWVSLHQNPLKSTGRQSNLLPKLPSLNCRWSSSSPEGYTVHSSVHSPIFKTACDDRQWCQRWRTPEYFELSDNNARGKELS